MLRISKSQNYYETSRNGHVAKKQLDNKIMKLMRKYLMILLQIVSQKLSWNAKSKIGSLENATHKPGEIS